MQSDLAKTLAELSAKATQGEWEVHDYCKPSERRMIWDSPMANTMCIEAVKPDDAEFITTIVNAYRTGKLIALPDDAVERVARALAVADAKDGCKALLIESESYMNHARKLATAALAALKGADHAE